MKWKNCWALKINDERVVRKFLLIPRHFQTSPTRWLELANIREKVTMLCGYPDGPDYPGWVEIGFAD